MDTYTCILQSIWWSYQAAFLSIWKTCESTVDKPPSLFEFIASSPTVYIQCFLSSFLYSIRSTTNHVHRRTWINDLWVLHILHKLWQTIRLSVEETNYFLLTSYWDYAFVWSFDLDSFLEMFNSAAFCDIRQLRNTTSSKGLYRSSKLDLYSVHTYWCNALISFIICAGVMLIHKVYSAQFVASFTVYILENLFRADRSVGFGPESKSSVITLEADTLVSCIFYWYYKDNMIEFNYLKCL